MPKRSSKFGPRFAFVLAALVLAGFRPQEDHVIAAGEGRFVIDGKVMDVHIDSERMALYGTNFHVGPDEKLNCFGASSSQLMICSFGNQGMQIDGKVFSEVGLTLVSPAGISFGPIAEVQALQNFTAIAGRLDTADFMAGHIFCSHLDGKILNEGKIEVGGEAIFVAGHIENLGSIAADTITWVNGSSVYIGSNAEHMRVRLTYDKEINTEHTPFANRGRLTAKGRVAFRSGDPYTQAFIQSSEGSIQADDVLIDAPSNVCLSGIIDAANIDIHRVYTLSLGRLKLPSESAWDLSGVGSMLCTGPLRSRLLRGEIYNEARFEELFLTEGLDLEMSKGRFSTKEFCAQRFHLNAGEWLLSDNAHVDSLFDLTKVPLRLQGKNQRLTSGEVLKLGSVSGAGQDLKLSAGRVELTDRMEGISKLELTGGTTILDQAHIEAKKVEAKAPLVVRGKSELFSQSAIHLATLEWESDATLRLRTAGDLHAPKGIGRSGRHIGTLVVEESKDFFCRGPIFARMLRHNGEGKFYVEGGLHAPGGVHVRTGGDLVIHGDCMTLAQAAALTPKVGANGGSVYLESKGGSVTVHSIETSGASGVERGGDAGAISIFQSDTLISTGPGHYMPKARAHLLGTRYVAIGGRGGKPGIDGDIKIGNSTPHFPDRCPVTFKRGVTIAGGDLTFGFNTAVGFREDANLDLSGSLYLSDMLVIGNLNLSTDQINVYPHEVGKITLSNGSVVEAGPTQIIVLGEARSSARNIRLAPSIGYDALPINTKSYATAYGMIPERRALILEMIELDDGSIVPPPGRRYLQSMTPSIALIAPVPELNSHPIELQKILNEAAAPIEILADMISSSLVRLDSVDLAKWEGIREQIMQTHENPASLPIERYQQRLRYAVFEPRRFIHTLGRSNAGRSALAFIERVKELMDDLKEQKNERVARYLERFSQPPEITRERWRQILDVVKKKVQKKTRVRTNRRVRA